MTNKLWVITLDGMCKTIMKDPLKEIINIVGNDHGIWGSDQEGGI